MKLPNVDPEELKIPGGPKAHHLLLLPGPRRRCLMILLFRDRCVVDPEELELAAGPEVHHLVMSVPATDLLKVSGTPGFLSRPPPGALNDSSDQQMKGDLE